MIHTVITFTLGGSVYAADWATVGDREQERLDYLDRLRKLLAESAKLSDEELWDSCHTEDFVLEGVG